LVTIYGNGTPYIHINNSRRRHRTDVTPDQRFPAYEATPEEKARSESVTDAARARNGNVPPDADTDADTDTETSLVGKPTAEKKTRKSKRDDKTFPATDYSTITEAYKTLKGVEPQGDEWLPIQQTIKSMFLDGRTPEQIVGCMKALSESPLEWAQNWTLKTVRMKLPEWIAGKLDLDGRGPSARNGPRSSTLELQKARVDEDDMAEFNRELEEKQAQRRRELAATKAEGVTLATN
jgi:hypothetical protein